MSRRESIGNVKASGVSPQMEYDKPLCELKSIGLKLDYEQAFQLKGLLEEALDKQEEWDYLNLTAFRESNQVTVTYYKPVDRD